VEIKCQLDATDDFYNRSYCLLNMFRAPLCPSSGAREYYTGGCCLWYLVFWFSSCRYGVELRVMCPVCGMLPSLYLEFFENRKQIFFPRFPVLSNAIFHVRVFSCTSPSSTFFTRLSTRGKFRGTFLQTSLILYVRCFFPPFFPP
jgi:hypothetical protein